VDALLAGARVQAGDVLVALAPGSVWATKRWPYYPALAQQLVLRGVRPVIIGAPEDAPLADAIIAGSGEPVVNATGRLTLLASAELLRRCTAVVTNDSAPQHLASAVGTPTITVFGPTVPEFGFGPLAPGSVSLGHPTLPCRPCDPHGPRRCPLGHWRCMRELETPPVLAAVLERLAPATSVG
jgi:heptosyltransferase-2